MKMGDYLNDNDNDIECLFDDEMCPFLQYIGHSMLFIHVHVNTL